MSNPIALELFAGAGGLSLGLTKSGFDVIYANELEHDFASTFRQNHKSSIVSQCDIKELDFLKIRNDLNFEELDLLSGGPPCQGFSTAGSKKESDERNRLFLEYLRAVKELKPRYLIFENVAGFTRLYQGRVCKALLEKLSELGYITRCQILEASSFGLPQVRKRTIIIGSRSDQIIAEQPVPMFKSTPDFFSKGRPPSLFDAISDLPELSAGETKDFYRTHPFNSYQKRMRGNCDLLTEHRVSNYGERMKKILSLVPPHGSVLDLPQHLRPKSYFNNSYGRLDGNTPSPTITRNFGTPSSARCIHPNQDRALSFREAARIQGFPDNYIFSGKSGSKCIQLGNAVPPIFGEVVGREIARAIGSM